MRKPWSPSKINTQLYALVQTDSPACLPASQGTQGPGRHARNACAYVSRGSMSEESQAPLTQMTKEGPVTVNTIPIGHSSSLWAATGHRATPSPATSPLTKVQVLWLAPGVSTGPGILPSCSVQPKCPKNMCSLCSGKPGNKPV